MHSHPFRAWPLTFVLIVLGVLCAGVSGETAPRLAQARPEAASPRTIAVPAVRIRTEPRRSSHGELRATPLRCGAPSSAHSDSVSPPVECAVATTWSWPSRSVIRPHAASTSSKYSRMSVTKLGVCHSRMLRP